MSRFILRFGIMRSVLKTVIRYVASIFRWKVCFHDNQVCYGGLLNFSNFLVKILCQFLQHTFTGFEGNYVIIILSVFVTLSVFHGNGLVGAPVAIISHLYMK